MSSIITRRRGLALTRPAGMLHAPLPAAALNCAESCCPQAPKPFTVARSLSSKANGIAAAPKLAIAQPRLRQQQAPAALEIVAADGPRGCKLKTRKVCQKGDCCFHRVGSAVGEEVGSLHDVAGRSGHGPPPAQLASAVINSRWQLETWIASGAAVSEGPLFSLRVGSRLGTGAQAPAAVVGAGFGLPRAPRHVFHIVPRSTAIYRPQHRLLLVRGVYPSMLHGCQCRPFARSAAAGRRQALQGDGQRQGHGTPQRQAASEREDEQGQEEGAGVSLLLPASCVVLP
jgi:hypothetical protein